MNWIQKATWNKSDLTILYVGHTWDTGKNASENQKFEKKNTEKSGFNLVKQFHKISWRPF